MNSLLSLAEATLLSVPRKSLIPLGLHLLTDQGSIVFHGILGLPLNMKNQVSKPFLTSHIDVLYDLVKYCLHLFSTKALQSSPMRMICCYDKEQR